MTGLRQKTRNLGKKTFGDVLATEVNPKGVLYLSMVGTGALVLTSCTGLASAIIQDSPLGSYWKAKEEIREDVRRERNSSQFRQEGIKVYRPQIQMPQYQPGDIYIGTEDGVKYERVNQNYWKIFINGKETNTSVTDTTIRRFSNYSGIPVLRGRKPIQ